jgi:hypothetical protein
MKASDDMTERIGGQAIEKNMGRFATLYQDPEMGKAGIAAAGAMGLAAHGFFNRKDTESAMEAVRKEGGEGLMLSTAQQAQQLVARSRPDLKNGYGMQVTYDSKGGAHVVDGLGDVTQHGGGLRSLDMLSTLGAGDIGGAKAGFFRSGENGGSRDTLEYVLQHGRSEEGMAGEVRAELSNLNTVDRDAKVKEWKSSGKADDMERVKLAAADRQYDTVVSGLQQNAGDYFHGNMDAATTSREILAQFKLAAPQHVDDHVKAEQQGGHDPNQEGLFPPPDSGGVFH